MNYFARVTTHPALACAALYMDQPVKLDFLWAGLCLTGAVYFIFRS